MDLSLSVEMADGVKTKDSVYQDFNREVTFWGGLFP